ncbi:sodium-coupled monocarboxylate transporter 1-like [Dermacentor silvarum]|uniref:sodium-coupled monocarboxylate transporter 1-like n=1 Tax=Dermacentor silvarum TaxID=543639 RepID=UPI0018990123|nr:sodium-coupled monocarboxylate transporter 1-like [Dermacentor silvarum]
MPPKSLDAADCAVFGILTAVGYVVGLYFSFARRRRQFTSADHGSNSAAMETFLGGRSLPEAALTVSVLASVVNGVSVVGFLGHFYGYGFHTMWPLSAMPLAVLVTSTALVPLLYNMRAASIFQYLRLRFDNKVGITACIVYFMLSQTLGAVGIYSAAVGVSTMFSVPLLYCNVAIGLAGTIYTALGGLRSVVWADCAQAAVMAATPVIIIGKVIYDSDSANPPLRPLSDFNATQYMFRTSFDPTTEENVWSGLAGALPYSFVRFGFDQMVVQRFMAARTLREAKRLAVTGAVLVIAFFVTSAFGALSIIYWYRDCDLALSGAISSYDQVVPYFLRERLSDVTMVRGIFLAGLLSASTSTVSSIVNSHAATFYIDIVSPYVDMSESTAVNVMRLLALASGTIMTLFAIAVPYVGSATTVFVSLYTSAAGPFAGLILLAISSPWVNAKGAALACLLACALQLWHAVGRGLSAMPAPPVIAGTMDRCPLVTNDTDPAEGVEEFHE